DWTKAERCASVFVFFFQAEDGIRDRNVTGVQTCALPILLKPGFTLRRRRCARSLKRFTSSTGNGRGPTRLISPRRMLKSCGSSRSEERRVGKEWRSKWSQ